MIGVGAERGLEAADRAHPVDAGVVDLVVQREAAAGEAVDDVALPQRAGAIEVAAVQARHRRHELPIVAGRRQLDVADRRGQVAGALPLVAAAAAAQEQVEGARLHRPGAQRVGVWARAHRRAEHQHAADVHRRGRRLQPQEELIEGAQPRAHPRDCRTAGPPR